MKKYLKIFRVSGIIFLCFFFFDLYIAAKNLQHSIAESKIKFIQVTSNRQLCSKCENLIQKINAQIFSIPSSNAEQLMVELEKEKCMSDFSGHAMGYNLGTIYQEGIGVKKNLTTSVNYYKKSAFGGNFKSMRQLGLIYSNEEFSEKNYEEAIYWLTLSGKYGDNVSLCRLGEIYLDESSLYFNPKMAFDSLKLASIFGNNDSNYYIGKMLYEGNFLDQNNESALKYLYFPANTGNLKAIKLIINILFDEMQYELAYVWINVLKRIDSNAASTIKNVEDKIFSHLPSGKIGHLHDYSKFISDGILHR